MVAKNFQPALIKVLRYEGGYDDNPHDPGGATNMGITLKNLSEWRGHVVTKQDVRDLSFDEAAQIYKAEYWDKCQCNKLPSGVDFTIFDFAVNSGPGRAAKYLQRIVGVNPDGIIGMTTLKAVKRENDPRHLIEAVCGARLSFLHRLRNWRYFGRGWANRVRDVQSNALSMVRKRP